MGLKQRKPMKRTPFKQRGAARQAATVHRAPERRALTVVPGAFRLAVPVGDAVVALPKLEPVRCEEYRRLVAALPCIRCGIHGHSQCAHANTGKGEGTKTDDTASFPLCCDRPDGTPGCHGRFDQGAMFGKAVRRAIEPAWVADTQRRIWASGKWPKRLPLPEAIKNNEAAGTAAARSNQA